MSIKANVFCLFEEWRIDLFDAYIFLGISLDFAVTSILTKLNQETLSQDRTQITFPNKRSIYTMATLLYTCSRHCSVER